MFIIVEICIWKFFDVRNFIIFNLENKYFLRYKQWFLKVKFLSKITPNIRSWSTLLIIVLLYSISNMLQLCFLQMCIKLHLSMESFAPEAWHQSSMSFRVFEKISFTLLLSLIFVKIMASSAYIECSMCLCLDIIMLSWLKAIINKTTDSGDPCGIPLCKGTFAVA